MATTTDTNNVVNVSCVLEDQGTVRADYRQNVFTDLLGVVTQTLQAEPDTETSAGYDRQQREETG